MTRLKEIRQLLGFTQFELAAYLGVSRSTVNLTELGLRSLKGSAGMKISNIELALAQGSDNMVHVSDNNLSDPKLTSSFFHLKYAPDQLHYVINIYAKKIENCRLNIHKLEKRLVKMQNAYRAAMKCLEVTSVLFFMESIDKKPKDSLVNDIIQGDAGKACLNNSTIFQSLIEDEIRAELAQAAIYEDALLKCTNIQVEASGKERDSSPQI